MESAGGLSVGVEIVFQEEWVVFRGLYAALERSIMFDGGISGTLKQFCRMIDTIGKRR